MELVYALVLGVPKDNFIICINTPFSYELQSLSFEKKMPKIEQLETKIFLKIGKKF